MDQISLSTANRRTRKGWMPSDSTRPGVTLSKLSLSSSTSIPTVPFTTRNMDVEADQDSQRVRNNRAFNIPLTRVHASWHSLSWIPRQGSRIQICIRLIALLYALFSLFIFDPIALYRWLFTGQYLDLGHQYRLPPWTFAPRMFCNTLIPIY
jgi:hypothetical protein